MMNLPKHRPMETHCMVCGSQLVVDHPRRVWVRELFDRRRWQAVMLCPKCGARSGGGRSIRLMARCSPASIPTPRSIQEAGMARIGGRAGRH